MTVLIYWNILWLSTWLMLCPASLGNEAAKEDKYIPLSKAGKNIIRKMLLETKDTMFKTEAQQMNLRCNNEATRVLLKEYPNSAIRWKHNSKNFVLQPSRMTYKLSSLFIQSLEPTDSGVFSCQVDISHSRHYTVAMYVVVVGQTPVHVLPGDSIALDCNSKQLGLVYQDAVGIWEHNGQPVRNSNMTAVKAKYELSNVDTNAAGNWTCSVYGESLHRIWTTASYKVTLAPVPPIMTRVRFYVKHNTLKSGAILMACAFVLVMVVNLLMGLLERKERAKKKEIEELRKMLGIGPKDTDALIDDALPLLDREQRAV